MAICTITEAAQAHINKICREQNCFAVSLSIKGGGCAGFEYSWGTVSKQDVQDDDEVIETGGGNLVIDAFSQPFLEGTEVDYVTEMLSSRMEVRNPNVESACGCGVSISF